MISSLSGILVSFLLSGAFFLNEALSVKTVSFANVLGQTVACAILIFLCFRCFFANDGFGLKNFVFLLPGWALCGFCMWFCRCFLRQILHFSETFQNFLIIAIVFTVGFMVYLIWLMLMRRIPSEHKP